jgi:hypothetical protein
MYREMQGLRFKKSEVQNHEGYHICLFRKGRYQPSVQTIPSSVGDRWSRSIVGIGGARTLKI